MKDKKSGVGEEPVDYLEKGFFHKVLLLFHGPAAWSSWQVGLGGLLLACLVFIIWSLITKDKAVALAAGLILVLYMLSDAWLLRSLPVQEISFGPWQSQLFALALPRFFVASMSSAITFFLGDGWGLIIMATGQLIGSLALAYGTVIEPFRLIMTFLDIETDRLPDNAAPIRILHISDLHIERLTFREEKLLELIRHTQPDLILITGDYLNLSYTNDPQAHAQVRQLLGNIFAPYGVFATLGSPLVDIREVVTPLFDGLSVRLLVNEWEEIQLGDDRCVVLLGLDCSHHLPTDRRQLADLVMASPNTGPRILLYHAPDLMVEASQHEVDLYLCGHTHGGQVRLPGYGAILTSSQLGKRYEMGLYRSGRTQMYVSRGVGLEGLSAPRVRFLAPPEITLVTMHGNLRNKP
ncbi:MAG TPA: metallophosphoesterase [Patescibacteria group bacterium]|nr:metallophosphoesterase [Patescibacteria group bacterium]